MSTLFSTSQPPEDGWQLEKLGWHMPQPPPIAGSFSATATPLERLPFDGAPPLAPPHTTSPSVPAVGPLA